MAERITLINSLTSCPACCAEGNFDFVSDSRVKCGTCDNEYGFEHEILDFIAGHQRTLLDDIDYDEMYAVDQHLFDQFRSLKKHTGTLFERRFERMLEVGAGTGGLTVGMLKAANIGTAAITDISPNMLAQCSRKLLRYEVGTPVLFYTNNGENLYAAENKFNLIVAYFCVHHIYDYEKFIRSCYRALSPGGIAVLVEPGLRFLRALLISTTLAVEKMIAERETWNDKDFMAILAMHRNLHFTSKYVNNMKIMGDLEDKHAFGRREFEDVVRKAGFFRVRTIPYGIGDDPLTAIRVYGGQHGASPEALERFAREVEGELPGPFLVLDPDEAAPSLVFVLEKGGLLERATPVNEGGANETEVAAYCRPLVKPESVSLRYDLRMELPTRRNGSVFRIEGWVLAGRPIETVDFSTKDTKIALAVGSISRPDVYEAYRDNRIYPTGLLLHCGLHAERAAGDTPFKRGDVVTITVELDTGQRFELESRVVLDRDVVCLKSSSALFEEILSHTAPAEDDNKLAALVLPVYRRAMRYGFLYKIWTRFPAPVRARARRWVMGD